jgi:hypothetical protein
MVELLSVFLLLTGVKLLCAGGYMVVRRPDLTRTLRMPHTSGRFRLRFLRRKHVLAAAEANAAAGDSSAGDSSAAIEMDGRQREAGNDDAEPRDLERAIQTGIKVQHVLQAGHAGGEPQAGKKGA